MTTGDVGAALFAFSLALTKAMMSPANQTGAEALQALANELDEQAGVMGDRPAAGALRTAATLLIQTE